MKSKGKVKIVEAGYTISVTSWENDGDNYQTHSITVDTFEKAEVFYNLMQLCVSQHNQPKGVIRLGNTYGEFTQKQKNLIINFLKSNPILYNNIDYEFEIDNDYIGLFYELSTDLLGNSADYSCRVMESCEVTYYPEHVYADKIL